MPTVQYASTHTYTHTHTHTHTHKVYTLSRPFLHFPFRNAFRYHLGASRQVPVLLLSFDSNFKQRSVARRNQPDLFRSFTLRGHMANERLPSHGTCKYPDLAAVVCWSHNGACKYACVGTARVDVSTSTDTTASEGSLNL